jgi:hypothetical protein
VAASAVSQEILRPDSRVIISAGRRAFVVPENIRQPNFDTSGKRFHVSDVTFSCVGRKDI